MNTETFDPTNAAEKLSGAIEARNSLLRAAASGITVAAADLRAAEAAIREAESDAVLASEFSKFAIGERDRRVIAEYQTKADDLAEQMADRAAEHLAAARSLDAAMDHARAAAGRLDQARVAIEATDRAAHAHNALLDAESRSNGILSSQHRSVWPKARTALAFPGSFGQRIRPELVVTANGPRMTSTGSYDDVLLRTAEQIVLGAQKSLPKPVAAA